MRLVGLGQLLASLPSLTHSSSALAWLPRPAGICQVRRLAHPAFLPDHRQLERLQGSVAASATQLKQLTADLAARDGEVAALREEVEATRRRLHALQVGRVGGRARVNRAAPGSAAPLLPRTVDKQAS